MKEYLVLLVYCLFILILQALLGYVFSTNPKYLIFIYQAFILLLTLVFGNYLLNNLKKGLILLSPSFVFAIISFIIDDFSRSIFYIILTPIAIFIGLFLLNKTLVLKVYGLIIVLIYSSLSSFVLYPNFYSFYKYKNENLKLLKLQEINFIDENKETVFFEKDKIIVLDFWTTSCSVCFKEFPFFEVLNKKNNTNNRLQFFSVNVPLKTDNHEKSLNKIKKYNYSFNNLFSTSSEDIYKKLNIRGFPTIMIIKNYEILYKGHPSYDDKVVFNNLEKEIEKVLNTN